MLVTKIFFKPLFTTYLDTVLDKNFPKMESSLCVYFGWVHWRYLIYYTIFSCCSVMFTEKNSRLTCVLFLQPLHSNVLFLKLAMAISPQKLQTWTRYGSDTSKRRSRRNWAAPWEIWQSRSISPKRRPPSLEINENYINTKELHMLQ